jgi:hypothetical protein
MADVPTPTRPVTSATPGLDDPVPGPNDPGGAHQKGYTAEPGPDPVVPENDPVPLASASGPTRKDRVHGADQ